MKKLLAAAVLLAVLSPAFAQEEYTLYYNGDVTGFITIQKDNKGKITITPKVSSNKAEVTEKIIDHSICPLIPAESSFLLDFSIASIIIDGNTTTLTDSDSSYCHKTEVDGSITITTDNTGFWTKTVVDGNTTMETYSDGRWYKTVVDGNTTMLTSSDGGWRKTVVSGNTTMESWSEGSWHKTEVDGNTTMDTYSDGRRWKEVVDKQGHFIFITVEVAGDWVGGR